MSALRRARYLARLVLAGYLLVAGLALAASVVQPQGAQWLCTGGAGMKLVLPEDGGAAPQAPDCPLCGHAVDGAPGPGASGWPVPPPASSQPVVLRPAPSLRPVAAAPPARAPPPLVLT